MHDTAASCNVDPCFIITTLTIGQFATSRWRSRPSWTMDTKLAKCVCICSFPTCDRMDSSNYYTKHKCETNTYDCNHLKKRTEFTYIQFLYNLFKIQTLTLAFIDCYNNKRLYIVSVEACFDCASVVSTRRQLIFIIQKIEPENRIRIVKDLSSALLAHRLRKKTYFVYKELR